VEPWERSNPSLFALQSSTEGAEKNNFGSSAWPTGRLETIQCSCRGTPSHAKSLKRLSDVDITAAMAMSRPATLREEQSNWRRDQPVHSQWPV